MTKKLKFGLIGKNISHSKSPDIYKKYLKLDFSYEILDFVDQKNLPEIVELEKSFDGINITSPYKEVYLNKVDLIAQANSLQAINCISFFDGKPKATNTDLYGVEQILSTLIREQVIILGDGVMARVIKYALNSMQKEYTQYSRKMTADFQSLDFSKFIEPTLIINCCSRDYRYEGDTSSAVFFWDLNYSMPEHEAIFKKSYLDGMSLLEQQAIGALKFWGIMPE